MRALIALAVFFALVFYAGVTFSGSEEICCSWVNTKYETGKLPQKLTFHYDGTYATYSTESSKDALTRGTFQSKRQFKPTPQLVH